jgi:hypothetical protein
VLKRFVNFMNNPDERTAVDQFGRGDKYYGVAVMMVTMPGLPMFGHGQIEGFAEKYGMEYRRSYWDEQVDEGMVHRHETQIFPLMRRRHLFCGAANFALFDFVTPEGWVDENVFAYSNRAGGECAIIMYNNAYNTTRGNVHMSTAINIADGAQTMLVRRTLAEALGLDTGDNSFYAFRDYQSGLEYIRPGRQLAEQGLFAELHAYQYHAFLDFRLIHDPDGSWRELERRLGGAGVPNLEDIYRELQVEPILGPYRQLMNPATVRELLTNHSQAHDMIRAGIRNFYESVGRATNSTAVVDSLVEKAMTLLVAMASDHPAPATKATPRKTGVDTVAWERMAASELDHVAFAWLTLVLLGEFRASQEAAPSQVLTVSRVDQWLLLRAVREAFDGWLADSDKAYWDSRLVLLLLTHPDLMLPRSNCTLGDSFEHALKNPVVHDYLQVNTYDNVLWINKDRLERMTAALFVSARLSTKTERPPSKTALAGARKNAQRVLAAAERSGYRVDKLIQLLS